jgi:hypothetical protein
VLEPSWLGDDAMKMEPSGKRLYAERDQKFMCPRNNSVPASRIPLLAAVGGSMVTRTASLRAFFKEGRSVVTEDMIPEIGKSFEEVFERYHGKL